MTASSKISIFNQVIGNYCMIPYFKDFKGKLTTRWLGPYEVEVVFNNGTVRLRTIDDEKIPLLVNGHHLKLYKKPQIKRGVYFQPATTTFFECS
jgi:hypothetical protein